MTKSLIFVSDEVLAEEDRTIGDHLKEKDHFTEHYKIKKHPVNTPGVLFSDRANLSIFTQSILQ
ncbi:MAG: hypothetical protein K0S33_2832 [Bacteroidetes bacterium]|jgi:HJR/Mrr/RecB family endonuclease|nr:hypothetical protein [Bacteroidota bacterium]